METVPLLSDPAPPPVSFQKPELQSQQQQLQQQQQQQTPSRSFMAKPTLIVPLSNSNPALPVRTSSDMDLDFPETQQGGQGHPLLRTSRKRNLLGTSTGAINSSWNKLSAPKTAFSHVISPTLPLAPPSPHYLQRVPSTPNPTPASSPFTRPMSRSPVGPLSARPHNLSDGLLEHELVSKAASKLASVSQVRRSKSEDDVGIASTAERIQAAVDFLSSSAASGVKDATVWLGKKPAEWEHYETLRDYATVDDCRRWALKSESPILRIYAVMALAEGHFVEEELSRRKEVLEELALALMNDRENVEIQYGCVTTFTSVGDEVCGLVLSFLEGEDRLRLAEELLRRFLNGQFQEPELSLGVLERCISLLVARKNYLTSSSGASEVNSDSGEDRSFSLDESPERQKELQRLIHDSRESLRQILIRNGAPLRLR